MRITSKGQITIPQEIRERFGFVPHTEIDFVVVDGVLVLRKARGENDRMRAWSEKCRGSADVKMTTDEIMALTRGED